MAEFLEHVTERAVDSEEDDDDDDCWDEVMEDDQYVKCIFCQYSFHSNGALWEHCTAEHHFNITHFKHKHGLDFYGYIKLVNFLRMEKPSSKALLDCSPPFPWEEERFLQPVIPDDPLLQYDIEDSEDEDVDNNDHGSEIQNGCREKDRNYENEIIKKKLQAAEERARNAESALHQVLSDLESMRAGVHSLVLGAEQEKGSNVDDVDDQDAYFSSYSHYSIHEEMLKDKVRTLSYKKFIDKNRSLFEGKVVLDVGCGSGILSIFAAQAGAKRVIGIDKSSIVYHAMDIVRENKFHHVVTLTKGKIEEVVLEVEKVDIIISEWMGYFLLFESMLDTVLFARDKWLAVNGKVYPDKCTMSIVGLADNKRTEEKLTFWEDVYGVKMSCMKNLVLCEPVIDIVDPSTVVTSSCVIKEINVNEVKKEELDFKSDFCLEALKDGTLNVIVGYFDIHFEDSCMEKVSFSTQPESPSTHWKQTVFHLKEPISLTKGEVIRGCLQCTKNKKDVRSLDIVLKIQDANEAVSTNKYTLQ